MDAPVLLAFTAGLVATLNPCGFAMLPAYLSFFVGLGDAGAGAATASGRAAHLTRALVVGGVVSAAFLVVFGVVGAVLTAGVTAALLVTWLPWVAMAVGVAIAGLGVAVVRGFQLQVSLPHPEAGTRGRGLGHVFAFGVSYALASLSCTLPVFLAVVAGTLTRANVSSGLAAFLAYGLGMSTVLLSLVVALALARHGVVRRLRRAVRLAQRISGGLLIVAGAYVVYFWGYTLATGGTGRAGSAPITFVDRISARVTNLVGESGVGFGLLLLAVVLGALAWRLLHGPRPPARPVAERPEAAETRPAYRGHPIAEALFRGGRPCLLHQGVPEVDAVDGDAELTGEQAGGGTRTAGHVEDPLSRSQPEDPGQAAGVRGRRGGSCRRGGGRRCPARRRRRSRP